MTAEQTTDAMLELIDEALAPKDWPPATDPDDRDAPVDELLERWKIDGERTALWAGTKLRRAYERRLEATVTAQRLRTMADEHVAKVEHDTDHDIRYFTGKLREYHVTDTAGTRRQSTTLPDGTKLATSVGSVTSHITDDEAERAELLEFLEAHTTEIPDAVDYPEPKIMVSKIKAADTDAKVDKREPGNYPAVVDLVPDKATGEIVPTVIPGVTYTRGEPKFTVTLGDLDTDE